MPPLGVGSWVDEVAGIVYSFDGHAGYPDIIYYQP